MSGGPTRLVLFDIDGTLVLTGGAGKRAMDRAFADAFGVANAFADVPMGGRTDRYLIERGLERWGMPAHCRRPRGLPPPLPAPPGREHPRAGHGTKGTMPGVAGLLDALDSRPAVQTALLTGNYEAGARIKLDPLRPVAPLRLGRVRRRPCRARRAGVRRGRRPRLAAAWRWPIDRTP